jgi:hypothetical protein
MKPRNLLPAIAPLLAAFVITISPQTASAQKAAPLSPMWSCVLDAPAGYLFGFRSAADGHLDGTGYFCFLLDLIEPARGDHAGTYAVVISSRGILVASAVFSREEWTPGYVVSVSRSGVLLADEDGLLRRFSFLDGGFQQIGSRDLLEDDNASDEFQDVSLIQDTRALFRHLNHPFMVTANYNAARTKVKVTRYRE